MGNVKNVSDPRRRQWLAVMLDAALGLELHSKAIKVHQCAAPVAVAISAVARKGRRQQFIT